MKILWHSTLPGRKKTEGYSAQIPEKGMIMTSPDNSNELQLRIDKALEYALSAVFDGAHHKSWVIDQMVRAITGCTVVEQTATDAYRKPYTFEAQSESPGYLAFLERAHEHGDPSFTWDPGIPP